MGETAKIEAKERGDVTLQCSARGAEPITFSWMRNDQPVSSGGRTTITSDSSSSSLEIDEFARRFEGTYSCRASNSDGADSESIDVALDSPVRPTIVQPADKSAPSPVPRGDVTYSAGQQAVVVQGRNVRIGVSAYGRPTPTISWRIPNGKRLGPGQSSGRVRVLDDDTLVIDNAQVEDEGAYRPIASNIAGLAKIKSRLSVIGKALDGVVSATATNDYCVCVRCSASAFVGDHRRPRRRGWTRRVG